VDLAARPDVVERIGSIPVNNVVLRFILEPTMVE